jgi:hypothetical protein
VKTVMQEQLQQHQLQQLQQQQQQQLQQQQHHQQQLQQQQQQQLQQQQHPQHVLLKKDGAIAGYYPVQGYRMAPPPLTFIHMFHFYILIVV